MFTQYKWIALAVAFAVVAGGAGRLGYRLASGECAQRLNASAIAYANERNVALEAARSDLEAQSRRSAVAEKAAAHERSRRAAERLSYEKLIAEHARPGCDMPRPVFERLRDAIRADNAARADPAHAARVSEAVSADARDDGRD